MKFHKPLFAGLICLFSVSALAAKHPQETPFPADYDSNGDGMITQDEVQAGRALEFMGIDTDASGYLSVDEARVWLEQQQGKQFDHLDIDHNGVLSKEEFVDARIGRALRIASKTFKLTDANADGALSLAEYNVLKPTNLEIIRLFSVLDNDDDDQISLGEYLMIQGYSARGGN